MIIDGDKRQHLVSFLRGTHASTVGRCFSIMNLQSVGAKKGETVVLSLTKDETTFYCAQETKRSAIKVPGDRTFRRVRAGTCGGGCAAMYGIT